MLNESPLPGSSAHPGEPQPDPEYRVIDLGKVIRLFWKRRYVLVLCSLAAALVSYGCAFLIHPQYDATVRLLPPDNRNSALLSFSSRNEGDLDLGLLGSRTVTDDIIKSLNLSSYFHTSSPALLRRSLSSMVKIQEDRDQFITITVRAAEPETAVRIANAYPEALSRMNRTIARSQGEDRWQFYEGPLENQKDKLAAAEEELKRAQQSTGMIMPETQVQIGLTSIASLNQQIANRQEQLAALEAGSTDQNPEVVSLKSGISSLTALRDRLQSQNGGTGASSGRAKTPELTLEIDRLAREVKFHETLFEVLSKQYENARVDDSYAAPIELIDKAVMPEEKSFPSRRLFFEIGFLAGAILAMLIVLAEAYHPLRAIRSFLKEPAASPLHQTPSL